MPDDEVKAKATFDTADFVIRFVGTIVTAATSVIVISLAVGGWIGYRDLGEIRTDAVASANTAVAIAIGKQKEENDKFIKDQVKSNIDAAAGEVAKLTLTSWASDIALLYIRYERMFDSLMLDTMTDAEREEVKAISEIASVLDNVKIDELKKKLSNDEFRRVTESNILKGKDQIEKAKDKIREIRAVIRAIYDYKCSDKEEEMDALCPEGGQGNIKHALRDIDSKELYDTRSSPSKFKMLFAIHAKLFDQQIKPKPGGMVELTETRTKNAQVYLDGLTEAARKYVTLSKPTNISAKLIEAMALADEALFKGVIEGDKAKQKSKYIDAINVLKTAEEFGPSDDVAYNLAAYYSRAEMFTEAMERLERAKRWGALRSFDDIAFFKCDPDFDNLRRARAERLEKLGLGGLCHGVKSGGL